MNKDMNKKLLSLLILLFVMAGSANAQQFVDRLHFEATANTGYKSKDKTPIDFSFKAGIDVVPRLYVFFTSEENKTLYKKDDVKTYYDGSSLGGGLGVKLLNSDKTTQSLDIRAKVLSSVGNPDWKRTTYDASVAWYLSGKQRFSPVLELGYRYIDSRSNNISNYGSLYVGIGIRY